MTKEFLKDDLRVFVVPVDIMDVPDLDIYEQMVYIVLRSFASAREATAFPSYATIAKLGRMSRRKAIDAVQSLVEKGLLRKEMRFDVSKNRKIRNTSNLYTIEYPQVVHDMHHLSSAQDAPPLVHDMHYPGAQHAPKQNHLTKPSRTKDTREREEAADATLPSGDTQSVESEKIDQLQYAMLKEVTKRVFGMPRADQVDTESIWQHWQDRFPQYDLTHIYAVMRAVQRTARIRDDLTGIIVKRLPNAKKALVPIKMHAIDYIANLRREIGRV